MQLHWLIKNKAEDLIIFFNGWGMDHHPFTHLTSDHYDVVMLYDYRDFVFPEDLLKTMQPYHAFHLIAYSMGVWTAHRLMDTIPEAPSFSLAINGTLNPIHDRYGIPPEIYDQQIDSFDQNSMDTFYQELFTSPTELERFLKHQPQRPWQEQKEELIRLKQLVSQTPMQLTSGQFDAAIICNQDKVMASRNQLRFWKDQCDYHRIDEGHFPFFRWQSWESLLREVQSE